MKRILRASALAALLAGALSAPAQAALQAGAAAPDFTTQASLGGRVTTFALRKALQQGPVVLYFYPAAFTSGCTIEAHEFAEATDQYKALGAQVIGVSHDDIATLNRFSVSECRSKFAVAADPDRSIMTAYDATLPLAQFANRVSYVIVPDGTIIYSYTSMSPDQHVQNTLHALQQWVAQHPKR
jgi:peroxiredoxin (alkyl hydroperoxide reductase subunit C)